MLQNRAIVKYKCNGSNSALERRLGKWRIKCEKHIPPCSTMSKGAQNKKNIEDGVKNKGGRNVIPP